MKDAMREYNGILISSGSQEAYERRVVRRRLVWQGTECELRLDSQARTDHAWPNGIGSVHSC